MKKINFIDLPSEETPNTPDDWDISVKYIIKHHILLYAKK